MDVDDLNQGDICRVCRSEGQADRQLFHPCICTGSIKWIHQDCLQQWMRYSHKEFCELCGHRFSFMPIYAPDMPKILPFIDIASGLISSVVAAVKYWLHYSLVAFAWLGVMPLTAYRTYKFLFSGSVEMMLSFPFDIFTTDNLAADVLRGGFVVTCTLFVFIGLVWLREQILHGGGPEWLEHAEEPEPLQPEPRLVQPNEAPANEQNGNGNAAAANGNANADVGIGRNVNERGAEPNDVRNREPNNQPGNNAPDANDHVDGEFQPNAYWGPWPADAPEMENANIPEQGPPNEPNPVLDEPNWNPMEWDRAAEELTWERLLGLDGSMVFLEHVFWVVSLNTIFIFIFAFCPYVIGNFCVSAIGFMRPGKPLLHIHGLLTTLIGYFIIAIVLIKLHAFAAFFNFGRTRRILGLCYIFIKVSLLSVVEIGLLPLICGWWLDICSLPMFDASLKDRKESFRSAPGTSLFIHWMFGMVYVYYFASFIVLLREILRPGVLWFLRNLNDPEFSPIQEMIHLSTFQHIKRLLASAIIFGSSVLLLFWFPIKIIRALWPSFLPFSVSGDSEMNELYLQLLILQIILPGIFEQSHMRTWLKETVHLWCSVASRILGIQSYMFGNVNRDSGNDGQADPREPANPGANQGANQGLGAAHQAQLQRDVPTKFQPYDRPSYFEFRLMLLFLMMFASVIIGSLVVMTVPVSIGRHCMNLWKMISSSTVVANTDDSISIPKTHELYTSSLGIYLCWLLSRGVSICIQLLPQGRSAIMTKIKHWLSIAVSYTAAALVLVVMIGVIPLLFGLIFDLVLVIPLRVSLEQTPIYFLMQDWALGVLYLKIASALILVGPDWALKRSIERIYNAGIRNIDLKVIVTELAAPIVITLGLILAIPYVFVHSIVPIFIHNQVSQNFIERRIYPTILIVVITVTLVILQMRQFEKLYVTIKNDKYLVGQKLVNYDQQKKARNNVTTSTT